MKLHATPTPRLCRTFHYLSFAFLLGGTVTARAQTLEPRPAREVLGKSFIEWIRTIETASDSVERRARAESLVTALRSYGRAVVEDSTVYLIYAGEAQHVTVPSDLNGWNPRADAMVRVAGTNLFWLSKQLSGAARFEYKLYVGSIWILDPINQLRAMEGYGHNSEVWMLLYNPPKEIRYRSTIAHGKVDSLSFTSKILGRTHPVFVYLPPGYKKSSRARYPTLYVNDGGEYITLALMLNVLDNLIADGDIPPIVPVFIDPRTDIHDASTGKRMLDYTLSDAYLRFLVEELRRYLLDRYRLDIRAEQTAIMGASLGGLISTYAAFKYPEVFGLAAAQSPTYGWAHDSLFRVIAAAPRRSVKFYIDTGTLHDAQDKAIKMKELLERKGYDIHYEEHPEGHNWGNWRARIGSILWYFWRGR